MKHESIPNKGDIKKKIAWSEEADLECKSKGSKADLQLLFLK